MGVGRVAIFEVVIVSCVGLNVIPIVDPLAKGNVVAFFDVGVLPLVKPKVDGVVVDSCLGVIDVDILDVVSDPFIEATIVPVNVVLEPFMAGNLVVVKAASVDVSNVGVISFDVKSIDDRAVDDTIDSSKEDVWTEAIFDAVVDSFAARSVDGVVDAAVETSMEALDSGFVV